MTVFSCIWTSLFSWVRNGWRQMLRESRQKFEDILRHKWSFFLRWLISSVVVTLLFWVASNWSGLPERWKSLDDWSQDIVMALNVNRDAPRNQTLPLKQFYDINDAAFRAWGNPVILPRDKVLALIQRAEQAGASVILVDIDLSRPSAMTTAQVEQASDADRALGEYLQQLNESDDTDRPIVILPRSLRKPMQDGKVDESGVFELVPSFFETYVTEQKRVFWGSVIYPLDEGGVIRRWRLAEAYCANGRLGILPSVELLAAKAGLTGGNNASKAAALEDLVRPLRLEELSEAQACNELKIGGSLGDLMAHHPDIRASLPSDVKISDTFGGPSISIDAFRRSSRIIFRIFPEAEDASKRQIEVLPALEVLSQQEVRLDALGRTILIGASFKESRDLHRRPFYAKLMSGTFIIANAVDTLEQFGEMRPAQLSPWLVGVVFFFNLIWSLFVEIVPAVAELLGWALLIFAGLVLGLFFINHGLGTFSVALLFGVSQLLHYLFSTELMRNMGNCLDTWFHQRFRGRLMA